MIIKIIIKKKLLRKNSLKTKLKQKAILVLLKIIIIVAV